MCARGRRQKWRQRHEQGSEEEKKGEEKEDEARLLGGQGEAALKMMCLPWSSRGRREEGGDVDVD